MASIYSWESFIRIHGGEPGARDVFEKAMDELLRAENPDKEVHTVKASQGDGGIDVYVHHEDGIDIYQCKFFMGSMNPSRWSQIKNSFSKAMEPKGVKVLRWVLCMPREMQKEDIAKWDEFKIVRESYGVEIQLVDGNEIIQRMGDCDRIIGTDLISRHFVEFPDYEFIRLIRKYGIHGKTPSANVFHYMNVKIRFFGRIHELNALKDFLNEPTRFLFWAVTGPGGIGKSKLVQELIYEYQDRADWEMVFIGGNGLNEISSLNDYKYPKNLLMIIDYAGSKSESISKLIQSFIARARNNQRKIRVLLMERQGAKTVSDEEDTGKKVILPEWFKTICIPQSEGEISDTLDILKNKYSNDLFPELLELGDLNEADYNNIMDDLADALNKERLDKQCKADILSYLRDEILKSKQEPIRPLYVLFTAYAALTDESYKKWKCKSDMIKSVYDRNLLIWEKRIPKKKLRRALINALVYTTSVHELLLDDDIEIAAIQKDIDTIQRYREKKDLLVDWNDILTGHYTNNEENVLTAIEPDLLGEYFVLMRLGELIKIGNKKKVWCKTYWDSLSDCKEFINRCCTDFGDSPDLVKTIIRILDGMYSIINISLDANGVFADEHASNQIIEVYLTLWENCNGQAKTDVYKRIINKTLELREISQGAAETYVELLYSRKKINGGRSKNYNDELQMLFEKWDQSTIITKAYVKNLGELAKHYFDVGKYTLGNNIGDRIIEIFHDKGQKNSEIANNCITALGKITNSSYKMGRLNQKAQDELYNIQKSSLLKNHTTVVALIEQCSEHAITQYKSNDVVNGRNCIDIICSIMEMPREVESTLEWSFAHDFEQIIKELIKLGYYEDMYPLISALSNHIDGITPGNKRTNKEYGIIWRWERLINSISELDIKKTRDQRYAIGST